jgi:hypothetical protein
MPSDRLSHPPFTDLLRTVPVPCGSPGLDSTLAGAALLAHRRRYAEDVRARLRGNPGLPLIELPALPTTDLGPPEIAQLADLLYSKLTSS